MTAPPRRIYGKYFCWTLNNPTKSGADFIRRISKLKSVAGCIFQLEKGDKDTPHFQGYIELKKSQTFTFAKRVIDPKCHIEKRRGTVEEAIAYCRKEDTRADGPWECGTFTATRRRGQRTDLENVVQTMRSAQTYKEVVNSHPTECIRYSKGMQNVYSYIRPNAQHKVPDVWLFYGETGVGKTRLAMLQPNPFKKAGSTKWFDGYDNQPTIILDDFGGGRNKMCLCDILVFLDRYPTKMEIKGGHVDRTCSLIVVTSNIHPSEWYDYEGRAVHYRALCRRFTRTVFFTDEETAFECNPKEFYEDWEAYGGAAAVTSRENRVVLPWIQQNEENETTAATILNDMQSDDLEQPTLIPRGNRSSLTETQESSVELDEILTVSTVSFTDDEDMITLTQ